MKWGKCKVFSRSLEQSLGLFKIPSVYRGLHCIGISQNHLETWRSWSDLVAFEPKELASHCHHQKHTEFLELRALTWRSTISVPWGTCSYLLLLLDCRFGWEWQSWEHGELMWIAVKPWDNCQDKTYLRNIKQYPNISKNVFASKQPSFVFLRPPSMPPSCNRSRFVFQGRSALPRSVHRT